MDSNGTSVHARHGVEHDPTRGRWGACVWRGEKCAIGGDAWSLFLAETLAPLTILQGKSEPESFYSATDEAGLLVMPGWCCCDAWQHWELWGPEQHNVSGW